MTEQTVSPLLERGNPTDPARVTVLRVLFVRSWPTHADGERADVLLLGDALERTYTSDAHMVAYVSPLRRRLSHQAIGQTDILMHVAVYDVDCPAVHGTSTPAPDEWRASEGARLHALRRDHPGAYVYDTRGGYRIVYRLPAPVPIASDSDAREWRRTYLAVIAYLTRRYGIIADPSCADWPRMYRLPRVLRDGARVDLATSGDAHDVGVLDLVLEAADITRAIAHTPTAYRAPRIRPAASPSVRVGDRYGLLYHLLAARGAIIRAHSETSYVIRCPRADRHSCGRDGDRSTLLYLPGPGDDVGAIHCLHAHCAGTDVRGWLHEFTRAELNAARESEVA